MAREKQKQAAYAAKVREPVNVSTFKLLYTKIEQLWKPTAGFGVLDLGFDYFLVKFDEKEDFDNALGRGPKMTLDHYRTAMNSSPSYLPCSKPMVQIDHVQPRRWRRGLYSSLVTKFVILIRDINLRDV
ncbi:hypothetical protein Peur_012856 [Populus x canadensis]